jgi:hypothetical protein
MPLKQVLVNPPYSLDFDALVQVKIQAMNAKGWSDLSAFNTDGQRI